MKAQNTVSFIWLLWPGPCADLQSIVVQEDGMWWLVITSQPLIKDVINASQSIESGILLKTVNEGESFPMYLFHLVSLILSQWCLQKANMNMSLPVLILLRPAHFPKSHVQNGNPLQYSCLKTPMDRRAWWVPIHGVTKSHNWATNTILVTLAPAYLWLTCLCDPMDYTAHGILQSWIL